MDLPAVDLVQHSVLVGEIHYRGSPLVLGPNVRVPQVMIVGGFPRLPVAIQQGGRRRFAYSVPLVRRIGVGNIVRLVAVRLAHLLLDARLRYELHVVVEVVIKIVSGPAEMKIKQA